MTELQDAAEYPALGHPVSFGTAHTFRQFRTEWLEGVRRHVVCGVTKCGITYDRNNAPFADALAPRYQVYQRMWCSTCRPVGA